MNAPPPVDDRWAVALYDFTGNEDRNILSIKAGDVVLVSPRDNKDWWPANLNGVSGFLPKDYLKLKPLEWTPRDLASLQTARSSGALEVLSDEEDEDISNNNEAYYGVRARGSSDAHNADRGATARSQSRLRRPSAASIQDDIQHQQARNQMSPESSASMRKSWRSKSGSGRKYGDEDYNEEDEANDADESDELQLAVALYPFRSENPRQLSFDEGQELYVRPLNDVQWWFAELDGETGMIPYNYVQLVAEQDEIGIEDNSGDELAGNELVGDEVDEYLDVPPPPGQEEHQEDQEQHVRLIAPRAVTVSEDEDDGIDHLVDDEDDEDDEEGEEDDDEEDDLIKMGSGENLLREQNGSIRKLRSHMSRRSSVQMDGAVAVCQYDFVGRERGELSINKGDFLWVDAVDGIEWWMARNDSGQAGIVPRNYVKLIKVEQAAAASPEQAQNHQQNITSNNNNSNSPGATTTTPPSTLSVNRYDNKPNSANSAMLAPGDTRFDAQREHLDLHLENLMFFIILRFGRPNEDISVLDLARESCPFIVKVLGDGEVVQSERSLQDPTLFIVLKGHIDMSHREARLRSVRAGQWFGESLALEQSSPVPATYRTHGPCTVLSLSRESYNEFVAQAPGFAAELKHMASYRSSEILGRLDLFQRLSVASLKLLGALFHFRKYNADEVVYREFDPTRQLFVIVHGRVHISRGNRFVGEGEYFGESSFLKGHPREETAVATEETVMIILDSKDLGSFIECVEEAAPMFADFVWRKSANALRKIPFFESVPQDQLEKVAQMCKYRTFATDEIIVRAGDPGTDFYVIESGRVRVEVPTGGGTEAMATATAAGMRGGTKMGQSRRMDIEARRRAFANSKSPSPTPQTALPPSSTAAGGSPMKYVYMGENEYFGEIAVLASEPRSATVRVMEGPCRCLILDGAGFRNFLTDCPQIKRDVVEKVTRRLRQASPEMRNTIKRSSRNLSLTHMDGSRDLSRLASSGSLNDASYASSNRSSSLSFQNEANEIEWITAPVDSLANIPNNEREIEDEELEDAINVFSRVGDCMLDCHFIYECWPIYMHPSSRPDLWGAQTDVYIKLIGVDMQMRETTIKSHTDDTVADVVDKAFQMADKMGCFIDPVGGPGVFALKVKSRNDFLVYRDVPLRQYKYIAANCNAGRRNHITLALVDLRRPPSSNGSGVHALSFLRQKNTPGRKHTSQIEPSHTRSVSMGQADLDSSLQKQQQLLQNQRRFGQSMPLRSVGGARGSARTLSMSSASSMSSHEMLPGPPQTVEGPGTAALVGRPAIAEHQDSQELSPPPPPPLPETESDHEDISVSMATPGKPSIPPDEWMRIMREITREAISVEPTWVRLDRSEQIPSEGSWPLRVHLIGIEGLLFPPGSQYDLTGFLLLRVQLVYAAQVLETRVVQLRGKDKNAPIRIDQWISFETTFERLPLTARLCFTLYDASALSKAVPVSSATSIGGSQMSNAASGATSPTGPSLSATASSIADLSALAWATSVGGGSNQDLNAAMNAGALVPELNTGVVAGASLQIFNQRHIFNAGRQAVLLWAGHKGEKRLACTNLVSKFPDQARLVIELEDFLKPMFFRLPPPIRLKMIGPDLTGSRSVIERSEDSDAAKRSGTIDAASTADWAAKDDANSTPGKKTKKGGLLTRFKLSGAAAAMVGGDSKFSKFGKHPKSRAEDMGIPSSVSPETRRVLLMDPVRFYQLPRESLKSLWQDREKLIGLSYALARVMYAVNWCDRKERDLALEIAGQWKPPTPMEALELLDCSHGDVRVREYAVRCLEPLTNEDLGELLIQLTQAIKYEPYHESFLVRFLLRRSWQSPREIGTKLFWSLRSEMHKPRVRPRFGLILRVYLEFASPAHRQDLSQEVDVQNLLKEVADAVQRHKSSSRAERHAFAQNELSHVSEQLPGSFQLCLDPRIVVRKLQVRECKVMNSKKRPLWLKFSSVDPAEGGGEPMLLMFKAGDDLRQDQMTLQMIRLMDRMWLEDGLDMCMSPYRCVSTGDELGMIEVVTNSETTANIQKRHGKLGALSSRTLYEWLQDNNRGGTNFKEVRDRFVRSCAGYVVATYVLGIGDRHSDNIMLNRDGRLFHIDFGHFLGHFKSKYGVKRERTAFVFTKEMAAVMGGKNDKTFMEFVKLCCRAYNILRRHGHTLVNLFRLMIPAGMPELTSDDSILYLCQKLSMEMTEEEASESFKREIQSALGDTYRRFDNLIHNIKT